MSGCTARQLPDLMTVEEFFAWKGDGTGRRYELVDGEVRAQEATTVDHGTIHSNLHLLIGNHLHASRPGYRVVIAPGVEPRLLANRNFRVPDLGVTCTSAAPGARRLPEPVLLIKILSDSNRADTWSNVPLYATLPSVLEILVVDSTKVARRVAATVSGRSLAEGADRLRAGPVANPGLDRARADGACNL